MYKRILKQLSKVFTLLITTWIGNFNNITAELQKNQLNSELSST